MATQTERLARRDPLIVSGSGTKRVYALETFSFAKLFQLKLFIDIYLAKFATDIFIANVESFWFEVKLTFY